MSGNLPKVVIKDAGDFLEIIPSGFTEACSSRAEWSWTVPIPGSHQLFILGSGGSGRSDFKENSIVVLRLPSNTPQAEERNKPFMIPKELKDKDGNVEFKLTSLILLKLMSEWLRKYNPEYCTVSVVLEEGCTVTANIYTEPEKSVKLGEHSYVW